MNQKWCEVASYYVALKHSKRRYFFIFIDLECNNALIPTRNRSEFSGFSVKLCKIWLRITFLDDNQNSSVVPFIFILSLSLIAMVIRYSLNREKISDLYKFSSSPQTLVIAIFIVQHKTV